MPVPPLTKRAFWTLPGSLRGRSSTKFDARPLVRGEQPGDVIDELLLGGLGAVTQDDPRDHALAELGIGRNP